MKLSRSFVMKILWPERGSLFAIVGGAIGLSGDITSFFSEFLSPYYLLGLFGVVAVITALLCLQRASLAELKNTEPVDEVVRCGVCDAMRFSLFSFAAFIMLLLIGQGQTATEAIGEKLGLIHADVQQVQEDVKAVREEVGVVSENVADIHSVIQAQKIIQNPKTGEEFFANAWTYTYANRNPAAALQSLEDLYAKFSARKMDAAELYYNSARTSVGRRELLQNMTGLAEKNKDATLLVVAGRYAADEAESQRYYQRARVMDPDLPFAYWDIQRASNSLNAVQLGNEERMAILETQIADLEQFIALVSDKPVGQYFYLPQYQPDFEMSARQTLSSYQSMLDSLKKLEAMKQGR